MREKVLNDTMIIGKSMYFTEKIKNMVSSVELSFALKAITLYAINSCWFDHLLDIETALYEVQNIGRFTSDPFVTFNRKLIEYFSTFEKDVIDKVVGICKNAIVKDNYIDLEMMGIQGPASTKTYMLLDGSENINLITDLAAASDPMSASLYFGFLIFSYLNGRKKTKEAK